MSASLAEQLTASAAREPARFALRLAARELSYAALDEAAARVAGLLAARGVAAGDRVGLMLPNVPEFPMIYYGTLRLGAVVVPMNPLLKAREIAYYLEDSGARTLFAWEGFADQAADGAERAGAELTVVEPAAFEALLRVAEPSPEPVPRAGGDAAVLLYTSGTTGQPKGAELSHDNMRRNAEVCAATLFELTAADTVLGSLPLFHSFGQTCAMNAALFAGATLTLLPRFDPAGALEIVERDRVTVFMGVPTMYGALLHCPQRAERDVSGLRLCVSGGASLPVELLRAYEEAFACTILEGYGLSETSPVASFNHPGRECKPGSIGTPIDGVEMKLVDDAGQPVAPGEVGEIAIRGHNVMTGYWNRPDATRESIRDGWFLTGDIARVDADGYYFIVDRKKDLIIRGGYNVYPREVEEVLYEHPAVREAAVIGLPDAELGEEVAAAVALKDGADVSADALRDFVRGQIAAFKYPRRIWFVDELPKGPTGKILKREIGVPE